MKTILAAAAATAALALAAPALAQTHSALNVATVETGGFHNEAVTAQFGWEPGVIGVEGELAAGVNNGRSGVNTGGLDYEVGVFGTAKADVSESFAITGRVGYSMAQTEVNDDSSHNDGLAYGAGVRFHPGGSANGLRLDFTRYDFDAQESDVWSVGVHRRF